MERIRIEDYPAVKTHLDKYQTELQHRSDQGDTPYNLRSCAYIEDFFRPKIVWGEISDIPKFGFDQKGEYIPEATTFLMTGKLLHYLFVFLNSYLCEYQFSRIGTTTGVGTVRWKKYTIQQLRVPKISSSQEKRIKNLVEKIERESISKNDETALNEVIFDLFDLDRDERNFIISLTAKK